MDGSRLFDDRNVRTKLVLRFLSSAILKSANNFGIIILKSCSLQCVLHGAAKPPKAVGYTVAYCFCLSLFLYIHKSNYIKGGSTVLSNKNTKNANFLFIVDMLKDLLAQELITENEYARAKKYYMKLTGADIVLAH